METELNASGYFFNDTIYNKEFEEILSKITLCYKLMKSNNENIPLNDENGIRDILLLKYLKNETIKKTTGIENYLFDRETSEDKSTGRVDIRIIPINPFINDEAYYIIECKRLDNRAKRGTSGLNAEYIKNGINRFVTEKYTSYFKTNAMIGFVVEQMDIHSNISDINFLLKSEFKNINIDSKVTKEYFIPEFEFHYSSKHTSNNKSKIKLYHLMFDFSDNL
ncbi:MAG: hypothetical protein GQ564_16435 [Bacteroidales bacterium]|nr:hypothetical protein [Bacteroidales bacterium]